jgi:hypothetical protein
MKDRTEEAVKALTLVRDNPEDVQVEIQEIMQAIRFERETNPGRYAPLWKDKAIRYRFCELPLYCIFRQNITRLIIG